MRKVFSNFIRKHGNVIAALALLVTTTNVNSACIRRELYEEASHITDKTLIPIDLYLGFSWIEKDI